VVVLFSDMRNKRFLPKTITKVSGKKETLLELSKEQATLIYNTSIFDIKLGNLLKDCIKAENTKFEEIPF
jgi:hypothetical protein